MCFVAQIDGGPGSTRILAPKRKLNGPVRSLSLLLHTINLFTNGLQVKNCSHASFAWLAKMTQLELVPVCEFTKGNTHQSA